MILLFKLSCQLTNLIDLGIKSLAESTFDTSISITFRENIPKYTVHSTEDAFLKCIPLK